MVQILSLYFSALQPAWNQYPMCRHAQGHSPLLQYQYHALKEIWLLRHLRIFVQGLLIHKHQDLSVHVIVALCYQHHQLMLALAVTQTMPI